jgi:crossover junction endodeoxyribonuclease RusA
MRRTEEYVNWIAECQLAVIAQQTAEISGKYGLSIIADRPDKRRRDLDNLFKATSDGLVHSCVIPDDHNCCWLEARWNDCPQEFQTVRVHLK